MKKVLVIGGGGREHAIVDALSRSEKVIRQIKSTVHREMQESPRRLNAFH